MDDELISKKDLLKVTGISYGQLYRWKRKNLIPEEWFIRKSAFTGQETFFPKMKILERIDKIIHLKDGLSLDQLADKLTKATNDVSITKKAAMERNIVTDYVLNLYESTLGELDVLDFSQLVQLYVLDEALKSGEINLEEGKQIIKLLKKHNLVSQSNLELLIMRKMGVTFVLVIETDQIYVEESVRIAVRIRLQDMKEKLNNLVFD
ncbi:YhbD family protein [Alkalihalobacillus sp. 1P02AB]|uniref:YhbD family protein n=1 Tax=Alkalihalobacillus sp. 1P02AB TaxID=3132260 RepID=UPI0039A5E218